MLEVNHSGLLMCYRDVLVSPVAAAIAAKLFSLGENVKKNFLSPFEGRSPIHAVDLGSLMLQLCSSL